DCPFVSKDLKVSEEYQRSSCHDLAHVAWRLQRNIELKGLRVDLKLSPTEFLFTGKLGKQHLNARLVRKIIQIVCAEMLNIDRGVLALGLDCWKRPVGYFSCQLDNVSKGQPSCLRAMTATVFLMQEDRKLALEQKKMTALVMCMVTVTVE
uniref:Uncharacterized protein n=1 Tax=Meleagris gallopavo TaxID=9103 RepID=A0A803Y1C3_MELGA